MGGGHGLGKGAYYHVISKKMKTLKYSGTVEEKGEGVEGQDECVSSCGRDTLAFAWVAVRGGGGLMPLA